MDDPDERKSAIRGTESVPATASEPLEAERPDREGTENRPKGWLSNTLGKDYVKTSVAVVLAGIFTIIASSVSANGAYQAAIDQQQATRKGALADEARIKRSQVYAALLDAANEFELKSNNLAAEHSHALLSQPQVSADQNIANAWQDSKQKFQSALNQVYVYGSKEAWSLTSTLASVLPSGVGSTVRFKPVDDDAFRAAYLNFQNRMRCEVPAEPVFACQ
ncbi:hypothetical protein AB0L41_42720 [Amycolatopsis mediterranei]|uniref:hypothetical protein n=1 Tax=Amycolatopsis mediterranei TaxID=33910 RepID=UPI003435433D